MNKQLIRDLAITGGIYDCICDPYDKLENGDYYSSVMVDLERFAEKIVRECLMVCKKTEQYEVGNQDPDEVGCIRAGGVFCREDIKKHFGVEE
jgi:hypothetical protein